MRRAIPLAMRVTLMALSTLAFSLAGCGGPPSPKTSPLAASSEAVAQCESGDPLSCTSLMQFAASSADREHYGQLACEHGATIACAYLGNFYFVRSRYPNGGEEQSTLLSKAKNMYDIGCKHDAWYSCVLSAEETPSDTELQKKAKLLTETACAVDNDHQACEMLAVSYEIGGNSTDALRFAIKGCQAALSCTTESDWGDVWDEERVCRMAAKFGASKEEARPVLVGSGYRQVPSKRLEARRTSGEEHIQPPGSVVKLMASNRVGRIGAQFRICLSAAGRVADINLLVSSGYPRYDRKLFEKMQAWRYRPLRVDGKPIPVCSSVTFVYLAY